MKMPWYFAILGLLSFEAIADIFATLWSKGKPWYFALIALFFYVVCNSFWLIALYKGSGLMRGANLFSVGSAILATFLGLVIFSENINRTQTVGLILGTFAMCLMFWEK